MVGPKIGRLTRRLLGWGDYAIETRRANKE